jgi:CYTH domain-containing protein
MIVVDKKFGKYVKPEVERKFLLAQVPFEATFYSEIIDHYITDSTLRLRKAETKSGIRYKLGQKLRPNPKSTRVILHTNIYLTKSEYGLLSSLPSHQILKTRLRFEVGKINMWIDQFHGPLAGLVIGEVDFGSSGDPASFPVPPAVTLEITDDERFTGGVLATTSRTDLLKTCNELGVTLP